MAHFTKIANIVSASVDLEYDAIVVVDDRGHVWIKRPMGHLGNWEEILDYPDGRTPTKGSVLCAEDPSS